MSMIPKLNVSFGGETIEFMESKGMSDIATLSDEQLQELLQEAGGLYALYNLIGRGYVSTWDWCFAYMEGRLPEIIKRIEEQEQ